ncbi:peroxidasin homolog [Branchiostoma floridae x Branchiostoma japonicum]
MQVSLLAVLLAMVAMVTGLGPTEDQLREAVTMATKELGNGHCVRKDNNVVCEEEPKHTPSKSQRHFVTTHHPTPGTIKLSQSAAILEKVAKNLMNSPDHFTLEQLGQVGSSTVTGLCTRDETCQRNKLANGIEFRTANGCGNNLDNPLWGSPGQCMKRLLPPQYGDDNAPRTIGWHGIPLPNARHVSLFLLEDLRKSNHETSHMLMQFGQFLAHEVTVAPHLGHPEEKCPCESDAKDSECFNVPVHLNDPDFRGRSCLEFTRSSACPNEGCRMGPRQQFYDVTAFVDASNVYGQNEEDMAALRDESSRFLLKSRLLKSKSTPDDPNKKANDDEDIKKELLPEAMKDEFMCEGFKGPDGYKCSQAGDKRVNENPGITSMHSLFMREHNRIARRLHNLNKQWDDDRVFMETRKIVGALLQKIAYGEYLPLVLGPDYMTKFDLTLTKPDKYFQGYDKAVNPGIYNVFNTAAYRFGHTMVQNEFERYPPNFDPKSQHCPIKLAFSFFNPSYISDNDQGGPDSILRGLTTQPRQEFDRFMVSGLTKSLLCEPQGSGHRSDLATLNIQRGRDHGLPGYNAWREKCGFPRAHRFVDLAPQIPDVTTRERLQELYSHVDDIDLFVGGLAEQSVPGGIVGPTFACLIGMQFQDLRKGDRFWFENSGQSNENSGQSNENSGQFTTDQLAEIKKHSLARILCDNTDGTTQMQPDVFKQPTQPGNKRVDCSSLPQMDLTVMT